MKATSGMFLAAAGCVFTAAAVCNVHWTAGADDEPSSDRTLTQYPEAGHAEPASGSRPKNWPLLLGSGITAGGAVAPPPRVGFQRDRGLSKGKPTTHPPPS